VGNDSFLPLFPPLSHDLELGDWIAFFFLLMGERVSDSLFPLLSSLFLQDSNLLLDFVYMCADLSPKGYSPLAPLQGDEGRKWRFLFLEDALRFRGEGRLSPPPFLRAIEIMEGLSPLRVFPTRPSYSSPKS